MTILERVLAAMKTSYAKYGFKEKELTDLAKLISTNLKDESTDADITAALTANEGYAKMMQSVYNRGITETSEKYKDYIPKPKETTPPPTPATRPTPTPTPTPSLTLEQVQKMVKDGIAEGLKPYKEREERNRLQTILQGNPKLKDVPKKFLSKYHLEKEEDADKVADEIVADWTDIMQSQVQSGKYVEAPKHGDEGSGDDDFRKMMEESANRVKVAQDERAGHAAPTEPTK